ncbi:MAG: tRNA (adenosine(37)-N6)-threonylcarbamoyltransferase complex transferase subunit TsaD [Spirochaetes bacterium]|nr:tRNA (adenosine(37)-N6)-threonylcarbamoyltransferase complex transferase subunit TsaD [Spirochaetota bacterium]
MNADNTILGLGIETSCDETAAAVVRGGKEILSNCVFSQISLHKEYFGVVPEIASRAHLELINGIIEKALSDAGTSFANLSYVAVTHRPGLVGSLLIGMQSAKAISFACNIPLVAINHLEAHLYAPFLEGNELEFPYLGLLVSGGNTALYIVRDIGNMETVGKTADDAVGEAFDKVAKFLGLEYPGGPLIEKLAKSAIEKKIIFPKILPEPESGFRFSYSGIKTAVINFCKSNPNYPKEEIVYSFQERALEILVRRLFDAANIFKINRIVIAGGVAANSRLREMIEEQKKGNEIIAIPSARLCTDNAAMVAGLGYHYFIRGHYSPLATDVHARVVDNYITSMQT